MISFFKAIIGHSSNVNAVTYDGNTALIWAARKGLTEIVEELLANGAKVNDKNIYGFSAIIYAAEHGDKDMIKKLLQNGANLNDSNKNGFNPIILAGMVQNLSNEIYTVVIFKAALALFISCYHHLIFM